MQMLKWPLKRFAAAAVAVAALTGAGCAGSHSGPTPDTEPRAQTVFGPAKPLGQGSVRTYVTTGAQGAPESVGVVFDEHALSGLPTDTPNLEVELDLPPEAGATPFNHVGINFRPHGHGPQAYEGVEHFDVHFYTLTREQRNQITATGPDLERCNQAPPPEMIPADYVALPGGVPRMGAHWIDATTQADKLTDKAYVWGSYLGREAFQEPVVTLAYLQSKPSVTVPIKQPRAYAARAYYPTAYRVEYNPRLGGYSVALTGMVAR